MIKNNSFLPGLLFVLLLAACNSQKLYMHAPTPPVNPFFKKAGDTKLSASYSAASSRAGAPQGGFNTQAAVAVANHFALTGSYTEGKEHEVVSSSTVDRRFSYDRKMTELGAGFFTATNSSMSATFNLYGGYGWGRLISRQLIGDSLFTRDLYSKLNKWYVQPSFNLMPGEAFRFGVGTRLSFVKFQDLQSTYTTQEQSNYRFDDLLSRTNFFWEPFFNVQFGPASVPWIKMDLGLAACIWANGVQDDLRTRPANFTLGLSFDFSKIGKRKG